MKEETMTLAQLKEYIREMPQDEILTIRFEADEDHGREDGHDRNKAI